MQTAPAAMAPTEPSMGKQAPGSGCGGVPHSVGEMLGGKGVASARPSAAGIGSTAGDPGWQPHLVITHWEVS
jgi:hypothetical protein